VSATRGARKIQPVARYGAIDCGTNALRLLVADVIDGELREITREMRTVRLGEGVDSTGEFTPAALQRTFAALNEYARMIDDLDVSALRIVATSASRDVRNAYEMIDGFQRRVGVVPEVIDGLAEARLSYAGAVRGLPDGVSDFPVLVADIGGGSTEFIRGSGPRVDLIEASTSINIGCVRMTERCLHSDPPTDDEIRDATGIVDAELDRAFRDVSVESVRGFIGLAGSVTTVAALAHGLTTYDAQQIHGSVTTRDQVGEVTDSLLKMSRTQRATLPVMHPGRIDVIGGGALVLRQILSRLPVSCVVASETDILDGIVYSLAAKSTPNG
jgi:exopolyphosphatase/guanosine-5'-triphosphate,3'-diphosphate pyrophosphatase